MVFKDPTIDLERRTDRPKIRKKLNNFVGADVNAEYLVKLQVGDTVEVELENVLRKGRIVRLQRTTARVFIPETNEQWRISGYYLHKTKAKEEIL